MSSTSDEQAADSRSFPIKGAELALPSLRVAVAVSLAYFTVAIFCINLAGEANNIASLWLPNAIGLVALLRHRPAVWPILLLLQGAADLSANVLMGSTLPVALGVAATDMLEVLLVAAALHWFSGDKPWFISSRWMLVFALASVCATAAAAFLGTGWLFLLGQETAFGATWRIWFLADTLGLIVVTPLLLGWTEKMLRDEFTRSRLLEVGLLTSVIALVAAFAFSQEPTPLSFLMFPFLLLITFRAGLLGATAGVVTLAITAMWLTLHGHRLIPASPGDLGTTVQHIQLMQIYILAAIVSTLPIAVILKQRAALTKQLDTAFNNMARGLSMFDADARLIVCNKLYREFYDLPEELTEPGTPLPEIIGYYLVREADSDLTEAVANGRRWIEDLTRKLARGETPSRIQHLSDGRTLLVTCRPLTGGGWVDVQEDITEKEQFENRIAHMAHHDALTNLPNRVLLKERLEQALAGVRRGEQLAFHLIDLDDFKAVNDTFGHQAGDELLKALAKRLRPVLRGRDTIARMGGDEFAAVQIGIASKEAVTSFAQRLIRTVSKPYHIGSRRIVIGTSVGIALAPADGDSADQLIQAADLALYQAKKMGRGTYCFFEAPLNASMQMRHMLRVGFDDALASGNFEFHYQPIVNLKENRITSAEALIRWRHPERGLILPNEFIPVAEESGHIFRLGEWAINEACTQARKWPDYIKVAVNLSPVQFKERGLTRMIENALSTTGLPASRLIIEITESVLLDHSKENLDTLRELSDYGIGIALDDFGKGYSSLQYLQSFPFNKIKIDHSFIERVTRNDDTIKIIRAIVMLAQSLGMTTTAEGIETIEQLQAVRFEGCDEVQGYFISRPLPAADIEHFFRSGGEVGQRLVSTQGRQENRSKRSASRSQPGRSLARLNR